MLLSTVFQQSVAFQIQMAENEIWQQSVRPAPLCYIPAPTFALMNGQRKSKSAQNRSFQFRLPQISLLGIHSALCITSPDRGSVVMPRKIIFKSPSAYCIFVSPTSPFSIS